MTLETRSPFEIATDLLVRSGDAMKAGDFDTFARCFWLPHEIYTFEGLQVLQDAEDLKRVFDRVRAFHMQECVTDAVRHTVEAEFTSDHTISTVHETRLLRGTHLIKKPYPVLSEIRKENGEWRVSRGDYAIQDSPVLAAALGSKEPLATAR